MMRPRVLVLAVQDDFGEVQELIRHTVARYELQAVTLEGGLIAGLADCVRDHALARSASATAAAGSSAAEAEGLPLAWVMGTREGDPHGSDLETFSPTSEWMPPGMRVNPILRWDYGQVWSFLRGFELPYCSLYDFGYTSIGSVGDTFPNPFLRSNSSRPSGVPAGLPAAAGALGPGERAGRSPGRPSAPARAEVAAAGREL
ncbi:unnamed protein product [Prorocentrum cordatum]|uniref:FAD synthase n=1 Tax=Prorocentrum cordatum TaxID=2364126 RepID=A0ABN9WZR9_9DINO|nr:unnamed protein product [Polarella glacialis]